MLKTVESFEERKHLCISELFEQHSFKFNIDTKTLLPEQKAEYRWFVRIKKDFQISDTIVLRSGSYVFVDYNFINAEQIQVKVYTLEKLSNPADVTVVQPAVFYNQFNLLFELSKSEDMLTCDLFGCTVDFFDIFEEVEYEDTCRAYQQYRILYSCCERLTNVLKSEEFFLLLLTIICFLGVSLLLKVFLNSFTFVYPHILPVIFIVVGCIYLVHPGSCLHFRKCRKVYNALMRTFDDFAELDRVSVESVSNIEFDKN